MIRTRMKNGRWQEDKINNGMTTWWQGKEMKTKVKLAETSKNLRSLGVMKWNDTTENKCIWKDTAYKIDNFEAHMHLTDVED